MYCALEFASKQSWWTVFHQSDGCARLRGAMRKSVSLVGATILAFGGLAQFTDVSTELSLATHHYGGYLGAGVSFADFNGDYIDDLTFADYEGNLKFFAEQGTIRGLLRLILG